MKLIPLTQGKLARVDNADFVEISRHKWYLSRCGYAVRTAPRTSAEAGKRIHMHRVILNTPNGMLTDHKNGDKLDNQRANLRVCTNAQNLCNRTKTRANASGFKGVILEKRRSKFRADITKSRKSTFLGYFKTAAEAGAAYDKAAKELNGEFARLNFV